MAIAEELVGRGVALADVVGQLVTTSGRDRGIVKEAYLRQVQRMHRLASDDFHATKVLTALERTLARLPYRLEDDQQRHDAERRGRWRWSRRAQ